MALSFCLRDTAAFPCSLTPSAPAAAGFSRVQGNASPHVFPVLSLCTAVHDRKTIPYFAPMCKLFFPSYAARTAGMQSRTAGTGLQGGSFLRGRSGLPAPALLPAATGSHPRIIRRRNSRPTGQKHHRPRPPGDRVRQTGAAVLVSGERDGLVGFALGQQPGTLQCRAQGQVQHHHAHGGGHAVHKGNAACDLGQGL